MEHGTARVAARRALQTVGRWAVHPAVALTLAGLMTVALAVGLARQAVSVDQGEPFPTLSFVDFRDTVWGPVRDLLAGNDPYDVRAYAQRHPAAQEFSLYAPGALLVGIPWAVVPLPVGVALWASTLLAGFVVLVVASCRGAGIRPTVGLVTLLVVVLLSLRVGRQGFYPGQWAVLCAAGAAVALVAHRSWVVAVGVAVALVKPQVGIPLLLAMAVVGRGRDAVRGLLLAAACSAPVVVWLVWRAGGPGAWLSVLVDNLTTTFSSPYTAADRTGSTRIDVPGLLSRTGVSLGAGATLVIGVGVMLAAAVVLAVVWRRLPHRTPSSAVLAGTTGVLLLGTPNELYACLVALPAVVAAVAVLLDRDGGRTRADRWWEAAPGLLVGVPFVHASRVDAALGLEEVLVPLNTVAVVLGAVVVPALLVLRARSAHGSEEVPARG